MSKESLRDAIDAALAGPPLTRADVGLPELPAPKLPAPKLNEPDLGMTAAPPGDMTGDDNVVPLRPEPPAPDNQIDDAPAAAPSAPGSKAAKGRRADRHLSPEFPITALGHANGMYFYLDAEGQYRKLTAPEHVKLTLAGMLGRKINAAWDFYPKIQKMTEDGPEYSTKDWDVAQLAQDLMRACAAEGIWRELDRVRGPGGWRDGETGALVLHAGDRLYTSDGEAALGKRGQHVYTAGEKQPAPGAAPEARDRLHAPAGELLTLLMGWNWARDDLDPYLALGWVLCGIMGGALDWRPAIWVTGRSR